MQPLDYLRLQMNLEGIGLDNNDRLIPLHEVVDEFPYFVFVQGQNGRTAHYFAASLSPEVQIEIKRQKDSLKFPDVQPVLDILNRWQIHSKVGHFKTYRFPEHFRLQKPGLAKAFRQDDPRIIVFKFGGMAETVYAVEQAGVILSACLSIRQDESCAESWVFTAPEQRGKGLAEAAVSLWATEMLETGKIPFYSHSISNLPSAHLADRLGLIPIYEEVVLE